MNARSVTMLYVSVLRSVNCPSRSMSMPSASHSSIRRTKRGIRKEVVDLRERGADDPAVVRRVDAARRHALARLQQERPQRGADLRGAVQAADRRRGRDVVHDEAGVGRRIEVGGEQVDVALRALRALEESRGEADAFEQHAVAMESATAGGRRTRPASR